MLSLLHRATGLFLVLGLVVICGWLACVALGEEAVQMFNSIGSTLIGKIVSLGLVFSLVYHCFNGIRHLIWDFGYGFELTSVYLSGGIVLLLSIVATLLIVVRAWF
jgi:succinate dehydrogenase / fumarate reductase cytochrome b subunit